MTWTYNGNPAAIPRDAIRWLVGDTDGKRRLVTDEEIAFALSENGDNKTQAAKMVLESLIIKFSTQGVTKIGDFFFDATKVVNQLRASLERIEAATLPQEGIWYAGGISVSDKSGVESDSDRVRPRFVRGMQSNRDILISEEALDW